MELDVFLKERLGGAKRLAVLGAGSLLKADDGAGVIVTEQLMEACPPEHYPDLLCCPGETAPENFSGKIISFKPDHLLVVDAADIGQEPGTIQEIDPQDVGGPTFCSHMLPLRVMIDFIVAHTNVPVTLLGIQPQSIDFDAPMTPVMEEAVEALCQGLTAVIKGR